MCGSSFVQPTRRRARIAGPTGFVVGRRFRAYLARRTGSARPRLTLASTLSGVILEGRISRYPRHPDGTTRPPSCAD